jgi:hypothetical protein
MGHFELDSIRALEINRVIILMVFREMAWTIVKDLDVSFFQEITGEFSDGCRGGDPKGNMIEAGSLAMKFYFGIGFFGFNDPKVGRAVAHSEMLRAFIHNPIT